MACRSADTAVLMRVILSRAVASSGSLESNVRDPGAPTLDSQTSDFRPRPLSPDGCRSRRDRVGRHDLDTGVVVAQDPVVGRPGERHSVSAVLAEADAVTPAPSQEQKLRLSLR